MKKYAQIILPVPVDRTFTYEIPEHLNEKIQLGARVIVQFGSRKFYTGIVFSFSETLEKEIIPKFIDVLLDEEPIISQKQLKFWMWISEYYFSSPGDVMRTALPAGLRIESESVIEINPEVDSKQYLLLQPAEQKIVQVLSAQQSMSLSDIQKSTGLKNIQYLVKNLIDKGIANGYEEFSEKFIPKKIVTITLAPTYSEDEKLLSDLLNNLDRKARKQAEVLMDFCEKATKKANSLACEVPRAELDKKCSVSALQALIQKGVLIQHEKIVSRFENFSSTEISEAGPKLSEAQEKAYQNIRLSFQSKEVVLLYGLTSSGKTEIYIQLIRDALRSEQQILYLLPEIALTSQLIRRLRQFFGDMVGVYHHKFNFHEKIEIWNSVYSDNLSEKQYKIIIGTRSSIFLPFSNLGLIIVDEEHDYSYKQNDISPRYNARDAAVVLGKLSGAKVLLGTATPSVESYYNSEIGKYALVELLQRYMELPLPEVKIVNITQEFFKKTGPYYLSKILKQEIQSNLELGQQIILFQNRRGFAPIVQCTQCSWIPLCSNCDVSLTYHKVINHLKCHICGFLAVIPENCPQCGNTHIKYTGFGTEKVEEEIQAMFPSSKVGRMDTDTTRGKYSHQQIINSFESREIDVLVGTQMVSKGLDFENVSLVGILDADSLMYFPDFRAFERSFQLITQIMGRAGRRQSNGKVILQTRNPEHIVVQMAVKGLFHDFYKLQKAERQKYLYPPFCRLILLSVQHKSLDKTISGADELKVKLSKLEQITLLGPEVPVYGRIKLYYIRNILIKIPHSIKNNELRKKIKEILYNFQTDKNHSGFRIFADADPV